MIINRILICSRRMPRHVMTHMMITHTCSRNLSSSTVLSKKTVNPDGVNLGYKLRVAKNSYRMGGKIGVETLIQEEKRILSQFIAHEIIKASSSEVLREKGDLRMDWVATVELVILHWCIINHRFKDFDIMGIDFMQTVRYRIANNLATRLEDLEKVLNEPLPLLDYCYPLQDADAFFRRNVQYETAISGDSDVKLAECLWDNLANSEVFEIEDEEHANIFGKGKKKRIVDRYFNPEGIEYLVYYVRKNVKLFDDKTFYDYKLCANLVDSQNQVLLDHQRHFRKHVLGFCLPEEEPLMSNRDELEKLLEFDFGQKKKMTLFERLGITQYKPKSKEESDMVEELNNLNLVNLEKYLSNQTTKLDLFEQANASWLWKTGRFV